jgi:hypothetical protein
VSVPPIKHGDGEKLRQAALAYPQTVEDFSWGARAIAPSRSQARRSSCLWASRRWRRLQLFHEAAISALGGSETAGKL